MGAAGKKREDELLAEIAKLRQELATRASRIDELKTEVEQRDTTITERDRTISELEARINQMTEQIANLEKELAQAQQSGDSIVSDLRKQLQALKDEFDDFRTKSARNFEQMQSDLNSKARKELEN
jgi:chromosome segregation ATPase